MNPLKSLIPQAARTSLKRLLYRLSLTASQAGQDYWIYAEAFNEMRAGYFVDIGAHDGITLSNTYLLEARYQWTGICIEANPITYEKLRKNRRSTCVNTCLDQSEREVDFVCNDVLGGIADRDVRNNDADASALKVTRLKARPLIDILKECKAPRLIDYLSIDVEGAEERVLGGFDFTAHTFKAITIELPNEHLRGVFKNHGYILLREIPSLDCLYIHRDFVEQYERNLLRFYEKRRLAIRLG